MFGRATIKLCIGQHCVILSFRLSVAFPVSLRLVPKKLNQTNCMAGNNVSKMTHLYLNETIKLNHKLNDALFYKNNFSNLPNVTEKTATNNLLWLPYVIGQTIFILSFVLLSFVLSSPNLSSQTLDVCHTSTHGVALVQI